MSCIKRNWVELNKYKVDGSGPIHLGLSVALFLSAAAAVAVAAVAAAAAVAPLLPCQVSNVGWSSAEMPDEDKVSQR
jgi:hypothetical protein